MKLRRLGTILGIITMLAASTAAVLQLKISADQPSNYLYTTCYVIGADSKYSADTLLQSVKTSSTVSLSSSALVEGPTGVWCQSDMPLVARPTSNAPLCSNTPSPGCMDQKLIGEARITTRCYWDAQIVETDVPTSSTDQLGRTIYKKDRVYQYASPNAFTCSVSYYEPKTAAIVTPSSSPTPKPSPTYKPNSPSPHVSPSSTVEPSPSDTPVGSPALNPAMVFELITDGDQSAKVAKDIESTFRKTSPYNKLKPGELLFRVTQVNPDELRCQNTQEVARGIQCNRTAIFTALGKLTPRYNKYRIIMITSKVNGGMNEGAISYVSALESNATKIALHEVGHSFGLGDLYPATGAEEKQCNPFVRFGNIIGFWPAIKEPLTPANQKKGEVDRGDDRTFDGTYSYYQMIPNEWWQKISNTTTLVAGGVLGTPTGSGPGLFKSDRCAKVTLWTAYPASFATIMRNLSAPYSEVEEAVIYRALTAEY